MLINMKDREEIMKRKEVESLFVLAGIPVLKIKALPDGYGYSPDDDRYFKTLPRTVWWFVKTSVGWIEIGWRKRVININWEDTPIRKIITEHDVTKSETNVHAYSMEDALVYLKTLSRDIQ